MIEENLARAAARLMSEQLRAAHPERSLRRDVDAVAALAQEIGRRPRRRWRRLSVEMGLLAAAVLVLVIGAVWGDRQPSAIAPAPVLVRGGFRAAAAGLTTGRRLLVRTADARVEVLGILSRNMAGRRFASPRARANGLASGADLSSSLAEQNDLFARALSQERQGDTARALATLGDLAARFPRGPLAASARAEMERIRRAP